MNEIQDLGVLKISSLREEDKKNIIEKIYCEFNIAIYYTCLKYLKNPTLAQDLSHDIFIKVFIKLDSFQGKSDFKYWIHAIARNHCLTYLRLNQKNRLDLFDENLYTVSYNSDSDLAQREEKENKLILLEEKFYQLSDNEQRILTQKYYQNISVENLANDLGLSESAIKMRLKRGRDKLKKMML